MVASLINTVNSQKQSLISLLFSSEKIIEFSSFFAFHVGMPS